MTQLQQLETDLIQKQNECESIFKQINSEKRNTKIETLKQFEYLIGKCFKSKYCNVKMFKILNIIDYTLTKELQIQIIKIEPNLIQIVEKTLDENYYNYISNEEFDTFYSIILNQINNKSESNLIQT